MEIVIKRKNNIWKDTYGKTTNIQIFAYNKISNMMYMVNYNLILNIFNRPKNKNLESTKNKTKIND